MCKDSESSLIDRAAHDLAKVEHGVGWKRVHEVAKIFARCFFAGDVDNMELDKSSRSIRRLAAHPVCPLSRSRLDELLAAYDVFKKEPMVRGTHLLPSHVAAVARLDAQNRHSLLESALRERLGVRELKRRARTIRQHRGERRGRPPTSLANKAATRMENAEILLEDAFGYLASAKSLDQSELRLARLLARLQALVQRGEALLDRTTASCEPKPACRQPVAKRPGAEPSPNRGTRGPCGVSARADALVSS